MASHGMAGRRTAPAFRAPLRPLVMLAVIFAMSAAISAQSKPHTSARTSSAADEVVAAEREMQVDAARFDLEALHKLLLPEFIEADNQILSKSDVIDQAQRASLLPCSFGPVRMDHIKVTFLDPDIATLVYHFAESLTCRSSSATVDANVSTVWVHRDARWRAQLHTEIYTAVK